jgi:DNA repair protein RecO (recombination protein O)
VLHSYPYKETSLIVDMFTRDHGRIGVVAKGAKRPLSKLRGVLQTFQPLSVSFSGKSELRTLIDAEWVGGMLPIEKTALLCGFYLNELLVKLLARDDPHPACSTTTSRRSTNWRTMNRRRSSCENSNGPYLRRPGSPPT